MADVRLTATNPEDSSVVPVACDAGGRLLLEEMPPAFDGTVDGDLTVSGKGTFAGGKSIIGNDGSAQFAQGAVDIYANGQTEFTSNVNLKSSATVSGTFTTSGLSYFSDNLEVGGNAQQGRYAGVVLRQLGLVQVARDGSEGIWTGFQTTNQNLTSIATSEIRADGAAIFSARKAGFTAEGHLFCTTRRGDTVILDATSNGLASWVEYSPPSVRDEDLYE